MSQWAPAVEWEQLRHLPPSPAKMFGVIKPGTGTNLGVFGVMLVDNKRVKCTNKAYDYILVEFKQKL